MTVLFCDLVGSTALSTQLDPEDYQAVVQAYHQACDTVVQQHGGYYAQPLGDGVLVYFGYPTAHEDMPGGQSARDWRLLRRCAVFPYRPQREPCCLPRPGRERAA